MAALYGERAIYVGEGTLMGASCTMLVGHSPATIRARPGGLVIGSGSSAARPSDRGRRLALKAPVPMVDGDLVEVRSRRGAVAARARVTDEMSTGQVFLDFHFPGVPANLLTSGRADVVTGCPEYKVTAVRIKAFHRPG